MPPDNRVSTRIKILFPLLVVLLFNVQPVSRAVSGALISAHLAQGYASHRASADAFREAIRRQPWRSFLWETAGREYLLSGETDKAVQALRKAARFGTLSPEGGFLLGEVLEDGGDEAAAVDEWLRITRRADLVGTDLQSRAFERIFQAQRQGGDLAAAVETLRLWRAADSNNSQAAFFLGLLLTPSEPDTALPLLLEAAEKDPKYDSPAQVLRRGINQASASEDAGYGWLMIGRALASLDQWDLAEAAFQRAVDVSPQYAEGWAFLGETRYHLTGDGLAELDHAGQLNARSPVVRALQALYYRRQGEPERALVYLEAAARQEPEEPAWQIEIGNTYVEKGDLVLAREHFQLAVEIAPQDPTYWMHLARFSIIYGVDIQGLGLAAARQAVQLAPEDPAALDVMGWALLHANDLATAERFLQRAVERDPEYASAQLHLGQLYLQMSAEEQALPYLQRATDLTGENDPIGIAARRLLNQY